MWDVDRVTYVRLDGMGHVTGCGDWYSETLEKEGSIINPYDQCVANKGIRRKQRTIVWYIDDNKVSPEDPQVVTNVIESMKKHFRDITVTRGENTHVLRGKYWNKEG